MKADAIIFDLDGTLWDSSKQVADAWTCTLREKFPEVKKSIRQADVMGIMGMVIEEIAQVLFGAESSPEKALEIAQTVSEDECIYLRERGGRLYEGLEDTLKNLASVCPLYIVSNCQCGYIECFLEYHHMEPYFKGFICSGQTGKKKGENIQMLMKQYGLKSPIYVGDTHMDYEAAVMAGIPFIYAAYGFGKVPDQLPKIHKITELPDLMEKF